MTPDGPPPSPLPLTGPDGPWRPVRQAYAAHGRVVVHGRWREWLPLDPQDLALDQDLRGMLDERDRRRLRTLPRPAARGRFVASRLLLKHLVAAVSGTAPEAVCLAYEPGGRPYARCAGAGRVELSLSHTGDLLVAGVSRRERIGVDVEASGRPMRYADVGRRLCAPAERAALADLAEPERERGLLRLWTLKEAYTKALGCGMRLAFAEFEFDAVVSGGGWRFTISEVNGDHSAGSHFISSVWRQHECSVGGFGRELVERPRRFGNNRMRVYDGG
ncbi:4'-phosphopantetheinyl transferase superfamily protein [Streptomyces sp. NBS 14/10]|uniref:4'-phosphopantetheinyl transferase family protein n=1 Tax=Streptomyces sp. NBS 14/10 TaxID=1945643 RepID=UPI0015C5BC89|nr:4'-phosphopantetheinyl transferase superfamily protein [Streptomyces sp. NBS 14/10]KAK1179474.1 4'-phosphopantetheinyl transferase superfamily protein [Streptomyces sp. NBS 14/10]